jgi:hypothetical protein
MKLLEDATKGSIGESFIFTGGLATIYCWGNFSGASVKLRVSPDSSNWFDLDGFILPQPAKPKNLHMAECWMRGEVIGGDGNTLVNLVVKQFAR